MSILRSATVFVEQVVSEKPKIVKKKEYQDRTAYVNTIAIPHRNAPSHGSIERGHRTVTATGTTRVIERDLVVERQTSRVRFPWTEARTQSFIGPSYCAFY
jgi:hypothetical protein